MTNFKLIAFKATNINEEKTLATERELEEQLKLFNIDDATAVKAFIDKARVEAGWPVAKKLLERALKNGRVEALICEWIVPDVKVPEMMALSDELAIMKEEVTVGLFKEVMRGYLIKGHKADRLKDFLDRLKEEDHLIYVNLMDAREFARRLSEFTGRRFRVPTETEWKWAAGQSSIDWVWLETEAKEGNGRYILRNRCYQHYLDRNPVNREDSHSFILVEDKN